jgi:hypothetical protein
MLGAVAVLTASVALASAPAAFGAVDGDPIATSVFKVKLSKAFKKQLKRNGVKMKPKKLRLAGGQSDVDPTTGRADLRLGKITFKKGGKKIVYGNVKGSLPGKLKGNQGKLFKLTKPKTLTREGFGASLAGVKVKFLKAAAKRINRKLDLNSLHKGRVGNLSLSYQPKTVKIVGGTAQTTSLSAAPMDPEFSKSVGFKLLSHCVSGLGEGITPLAPATKQINTPGPLQIRFTFPVIGGEISPTGTEGFTELDGGLRLRKSESGVAPTNCAANPYGELTQVKIQNNLSSRTVSSEVEILASPCPPGYACSPGPKGRAVGQTTDPSRGVTISSDPVNRTITISGAVVRLAGVSAQTLNAVFPCASGADCTPPDPDNTLLEGDPFGTSMLTVQTR